MQKLFLKKKQQLSIFLNYLPCLSISMLHFFEIVSVRTFSLDRKREKWCLEECVLTSHLWKDQILFWIEITRSLQESSFFFYRYKGIFKFQSPPKSSASSLFSIFSTSTDRISSEGDANSSLSTQHSPRRAPPTDMSPVFDQPGQTPPRKRFVYFDWWGKRDIRRPVLNCVIRVFTRHFSKSDPQI